MSLSPLAGQPAPASILVDVPRLITAYFTERPDPAVAAERVSFGTSGHRGSSFDRAFNEWHILAITQAICEYRARQGIDGPAVRRHRHARAVGAGVRQRARGPGRERRRDDDRRRRGIDADARGLARDPHATTAAGRAALADGIVVTPSHNPPDGRRLQVQSAQRRPRRHRRHRLDPGSRQRAHRRRARRRPPRAARTGAGRGDDASPRLPSPPTSTIWARSSTWTRSAVRACVSGSIRSAAPGSGTGDGSPSATKLDLTVVSEDVDPTFRFMTVDWDGKIRMDPSSPYAMRRLIALKDRFDVAFGCDTDHDRHGIVTRSAGLLPPEPLSGGGDRLSLPTSPALACRRRRGEDGRLEQHDRPRRGEARAHAA